MDEHDPESCCTIFTFWRSKTSEPATTDRSRTDSPTRLAMKPLPPYNKQEQPLSLTPIQTLDSLLIHTVHGVYGRRSGEKTCTLI